MLGAEGGQAAEGQALATWQRRRKAGKAGKVSPTCAERPHNQALRDFEVNRISHSLGPGACLTVSARFLT